MRKYYICLFIGALFVAIIGCAAHQKSEKKSRAENLPPPSAEPLTVAINDIVGKGVEDSAATVITNKICATLSQRKNFTVLCADDARAIMRMKGHSEMMGAGDEEAEQIAASEEKSPKKADRLIEGTLGKVGNQFVLSLKVVEPSTNNVLNRQEITADDDPAQLLPMLDEALRILIP